MKQITGNLFLSTACLGQQNKKFMKNVFLKNVTTCNSAEMVPTKELMKRNNHTGIGRHMEAGTAQFKPLHLSEHIA